MQRNKSRDRGPLSYTVNPKPHLVVCAEIQRRGDRSALLETDFRGRILCEQVLLLCFEHREDDAASSRGRGHQ